MNIYIPFLSGTRTDELKYCLRSIETYLKNVDNIFVITTDELPQFKDIEIIHHLDNPHPGQKEWNVINKIRHRAKGDFLFMNDDHYLLSEYDANTFPNYFSYSLSYKMKVVFSTNPYKHTLRNTREMIGGSAKYYDIHCPMRMNADKVMSTPFGKKNYGVCFKTVYAYYNVDIYDCSFTFDSKIDGITILHEGTRWFSTKADCDISFLEKFYPVKSKYEI